MSDPMVQLGACADSRLGRKKAVALLRKLIRTEIKEVSALSAQLQEPKADVWSLSNRLSHSAKWLAIYQTKLNALLNRADEVSILKRAAAKAPEKKPDSFTQCNYCDHPVHLNACDATVTWKSGFGRVMEPCGCKQ